MKLNKVLLASLLSFALVACGGKAASDSVWGDTSSEIENTSEVASSEETSEVETSISEDSSIEESTSVESEVPPEIKHVSSVEIANGDLNLETTDSVDLIINVLPADATDLTYTLTADPQGVVEIAGNTVTAVNAGTTTITAKTTDGDLTDTITVVVAQKITSLDAPTNIIYNADNNMVSFTASENALAYNVTFVEGENIIETITNLTAVEFEIPSTVIGHLVNMNITAVRDAITSEPATKAIGVVKDVDKTLEAEDYVLNTNKISIDDGASGGKYGLSFDQNGEGMYYRYFALEAGTKAIDVYYATAMPNSYMMMYVNNDTGTKVNFANNTNWFGDGRNFAVATVNVALVQGWNDIYLIRDGHAGDNPAWGGYGQIDKIVVKGSNKFFDAAAYFDAYNNCTRFRFEAETCAWRLSGGAVADMSNTWPSMHGYVGEQNTAGDGITFTFNITKAGNYNMVLTAAGEATSYDINVDGITTPYDNFRAQTAWNVDNDSATVALTLTAGSHTISITRPDRTGASWSCLDYVTLTYAN